jgi:hypothetical protein
MELSGRRSSAGWRVIVALVGLMLMLVAYYAVHKPLDPVLIGSLGGALLDLLTAFLIATVAGGLGRRIYIVIESVGTRYISSLSETNSLSRTEKVALEALLGLGILSLIALLLGLVGLYSGIGLWGALLIIVLLCLRSVIGWLRDSLALARRAFNLESGWPRFLAIITFILLFFALLHTITPPTAFDAINYHLVGPTRYLDAGRILAQADNHFLGFPQGVEILFGVAIGLFGRDTAAAPIHFIFGLLGLLAVAGLVKRYTNAATAWLSVTLLIGSFSIWLLFGWPYVDLAMMAYGAVALVAAVQWRENSLGPEAKAQGDIKWLILMGVFGGLALGVKYTAVGLLLGLGLLVLVSYPRQAIRNGLILGGAIVVVFLPWALKGLLLYQNPIYPFLLGGLNWDAGRSYTFSTPGTGLLGSPNAWQLAVLPITATVFGIEKLDQFGYTFTLSPWLLTAPFLLLLGWHWLDDRVRRLAWVGLLIGLSMLGFWIVMAASTSIGVQTRLMMMALPTAAVLGSLGFYSLSRWPRKPFNVYFIAQALISLTLIFTVLDVIRDTVRGQSLSYLMGSTSRNEYLNANLGIYINAMRRLADLPDDSTVRLMFEPRAYYCPPTVNCIPDILFDHWPRPLRQGKTPDEIFQGWKGAGEDYLLLFNPGYRFSAQDSRFISENALFPDARDQWMSPVWEDEVGGYTLYEWKG